MRSCQTGRLLHASLCSSCTCHWLAPRYPPPAAPANLSSTSASIVPQVLVVLHGWLRTVDTWLLSYVNFMHIGVGGLYSSLHRCAHILFEWKAVLPGTLPFSLFGADENRCGQLLSGNLQQSCAGETSSAKQLSRLEPHACTCRECRPLRRDAQLPAF